MSRFPRPCVECGRPCLQGRCEDHRLPDRRPTLAARGSRWASEQFRRAVLRRDKFTCKACGLHDPSGKLLEADHIIPIEQGGSVNPANGQCLCLECHKAKTAAEAAFRHARRDS